MKPRGHLVTRNKWHCQKNKITSTILIRSHNEVPFQLTHGTSVRWHAHEALGALLTFIHLNRLHRGGGAPRRCSRIFGPAILRNALVFDRNAPTSALSAVRKITRFYPRTKIIMVILVGKQVDGRQQDTKGPVRGDVAAEGMMWMEREGGGGGGGRRYSRRGRSFPSKMKQTERKLAARSRRMLEQAAERQKEGGRREAGGGGLRSGSLLTLSPL